MIGGSALGVIAFVVTLTVMVLLHEFGHYITARKFGMKVEAYFFGFGPRLFSWRRGDTEYGVRAIPLGGYVKIAGMNPFVDIPERDKERIFGAKPAWQRAIVLSAGSATHFVLAFIILVFLFAIVGEPRLTTTVADVSATVESEQGEVPSPASLAGIEGGDRIVSVDGQRISDWREVQSLIGSSPGREIEITVERPRGDSIETVTLRATPVPATIERDGSETIIGLVGLYPESTNVSQPIPTAARSSIESIGFLTRASVIGIVNLFSPDGIKGIVSSVRQSGERSIDGTSAEPIGPVGAGRLAGQAAGAGEYQTLFSFLAAFVVFVGVINLVPLPILDGGYLGLLLIEKVIRRPVDMRKVVPAMVVVFGLFVALAITLLYLDLVRPLQNPFQ